jgi:hypothetical protein
MASPVCCRWHQGIAGDEEGARPAGGMTEIPTGWDGYPPDGHRQYYHYHWIQVSPAVRDVMMWADGVWISVRFGTTRPSGAKHWLYLCSVEEPR